MRRQAFADEVFERCRKPTRREIFLAEMDKIIPWNEFCGVIEPFIPSRRAQAVGRSGWNGCLNIHCLPY